jgi:hypothetical protein
MVPASMFILSRQQAIQPITTALEEAWQLPDKTPEERTTRLKAIQIAQEEIWQLPNEMPCERRMRVQQQQKKLQPLKVESRVQEAREYMKSPWNAAGLMYHAHSKKVGWSKTKARVAATIGTIWLFFKYQAPVFGVCLAKKDIQLIPAVHGELCFFEKQEGWGKDDSHGKIHSVAARIGIFIGGLCSVNAPFFLLWGLFLALKFAVVNLKDCCCYHKKNSSQIASKNSFLDSSSTPENSLQDYSSRVQEKASSSTSAD